MNHWSGCGIAALLCFFFCSCIRPVPDGIALAGGEPFVPERELVTRILAEDGFLEPLGFRFDPQTGLTGRPEQTGRSAGAMAVIEFHASWGRSGGIPVSRTWIVPRETPLAGRTETSRAACLAGEETLVPIGEIAPPYVGLLVDGLCAADEAYPLIRSVSISVKETQAAGKNRSRRARRRLLERIAGLETKLAETLKPFLSGAPTLVWLCAAGDLMLGRGSGDILLREGPAGVFGKTAEYLAGADLCMVNLEGSVSGRGTAIEKAYTFRFDPRVVPALKTAGIDAALLANNHVFDFGETAFLDTLEHLANSGIAAPGAGRNI
ncbi:MAG: CapA family protein, partial [Treponema sp.]|nr:CapA family protein [Treponema sp.]